VAGTLEAIRDRLDDALAFWLGDAVPPVHRAVAVSGWRRDPDDRFCRRCGESVGAGEAAAIEGLGDAGGCAGCRGRPAIADGVVRLGCYRGHLREWIRRIKYRDRWTEMAAHLGAELGHAIDAARVAARGRSIIVPMPMPWTRRLYRGIDHARVIADGAASVLHAPVLRVLSRSGGPTQAGLSRSTRLRFRSRGMVVRRRPGGWQLGGLDIVLVDDVLTTGASMRAAVRALRGVADGRILAAVLAVADPPSRHARADSESPGRAVPTPDRGLPSLPGRVG
jgi:predicted amidophosphoribosyltransferase